MHTYTPHITNIHVFDHLQYRKLSQTLDNGRPRNEAIAFPQVTANMHVVLPQNPLLSLLSYLWHYNRYFAFTRDNRTHPTLNVEKTLDVKN